MRGTKRNDVVGSYVVSDIDCMRQRLIIDFTSRSGGEIPLIRLESKRLTEEKLKSEVLFIHLAPRQIM